MKAFGSGHNWHDIAVTNDYIIDTSALDKLLAVDLENFTVKVEGGIKLHQLNDLLRKYNLAMKNLGEITQQSIAGVVSTGTHGTGLSTGTLSSLIKSIELVIANGTILQLERDEPTHSDYFAAAQTGLGAVG